MLLWPGLELLGSNVPSVSADMSKGEYNPRLPHLAGVWLWDGKGLYSKLVTIAFAAPAEPC